MRPDFLHELARIGALAHAFRPIPARRLAGAHVPVSPRRMRTHFVRRAPARAKREAHHRLPQQVYAPDSPRRIPSAAGGSLRSGRESPSQMA